MKCFRGGTNQFTQASRAFPMDGLNLRDSRFVLARPARSHLDQLSQHNPNYEIRRLLLIFQIQV